jgi:hypothetical protein
MKRTATSALLILLLACAGCSRGQTSGDNQGAAGNVPPSTTSAVATDAGSTPGAKAPAGPAAPSTIQPGVAPPRIKRVLDKAQDGRKASFTITYRFTTGTGSGRETSTWRLAQAPPKFRFEQLSGDRHLSVFDGKVMYTCQTLGGRRTCSRFGGPPDDSNLGESHPGNIIDQLNSMTVMFGQAVQPETGSKTVAGQRLECVTFVTTAAGSPDASLCLTRQGAVGYAAFAGSTLTMTSFRNGVRADDFVAPR